jgi:hypothetical protein
MRKLANQNFQSEDNQHIIGIELTYNPDIIKLPQIKRKCESIHGEIPLRKVKLVLKRALGDYEDKRREIDEFYDVYDDLSEQLGEAYSASKLRKWTNVNGNDNSYPDPEKALNICEKINDWKPVKILIKYLEARMELHNNSLQE